jgi:hypothetical protein
MTLDEGLPVWGHAALRRYYEFEASVHAQLKAEPEGEWVPLARATEQADRDQRAADVAERDLCESRNPWPEIFRLMPSWMRNVIYARGHG